MFRLGLKRVSTALIREVIEGELKERGYAARLEQPGAIEVPLGVVRRLIVEAYVRREAGLDARHSGPRSAGSSPASRPTSTTGAPT